MQYSVVAVLLVLVVVAVVAFAARIKWRQARVLEVLATQLGWVPLSCDSATLGQYLPLYLQVLYERGSGVHVSASFSRCDETYSDGYSAVIGDHQVVFFKYELTEYYVEDDPVVGQPREKTTTSHFIVFSTELSGFFGSPQFA